MIPGFSKLDIDAEGLKKKFGVLGEPLVLGVIVGALIGWAAQLDIKKILFLGVTMGAVMELIPRITALFIDGLKPILSLIHISEPTRLGMISYAVFCLKKKNY